MKIYSVGFDVATGDDQTIYYIQFGRDMDSRQVMDQPGILGRLQAREIVAKLNGVKKYLEFCDECGAVYHGSMCCNTCREVYNARMKIRFPGHNPLPMLDYSQIRPIHVNEARHIKETVDKVIQNTRRDGDKNVPIVGTNMSQQGDRPC